MPLSFQKHYHRRHNHRHFVIIGIIAVVIVATMPAIAIIVVAIIFVVIIVVFNIFSLTIISIICIVSLQASLGGSQKQKLLGIFESSWGYLKVHRFIFFLSEKTKDSEFSNICFFI